VADQTIGQRLIALVKKKYGWDFSKVPVEMLGDLLDKTLNGGDLAVYALLQCWGQEDGRFYYNRKAFSELTGIPERTIRVHIQRLEDAKWCARHKEPTQAVHKYSKVVVTVFPGKDTPPVPSGQRVRQKSAGGSGRNLPIEVEEREGEALSEKEEAAPAARASSAPLTSFRGGTREAGQAAEDSGKEDLHAVSNAPRHRGPSMLPNNYNPEEVAAKKKKAKAEAEEAAKNRVAKWPPETGPDVFRKWADEVQRRHPSWKKPRGVAWGKVGALGKKLLQRFEPDDLLAVMRVAIWDWRAIRGDEKFYARTHIPELTEIVRFAEQLAICTDEGWKNHKYRVSAYVGEFVRKIAPEDIVDMSAVANECRGRRRA